ncbi:1-aminocyclopropane-1-carboxylate synthase 7 [Nemania sp. FL0916]|nr:1-aminocyclopropane-1-carboxylate synthase 7 [Nemania sp. FL0916]
MAAEMGLSSRGAGNVDSVLPSISAAIDERAKKANTNIDLGTAENWLIRDELIAICKKSINDDLTDKHLSYPDGFAGDTAMLEASASFFNEYFKPATPVLAQQHIATAPGAAASLDALLYNICEPGDGVLVPSPFWNGFDWLFGVRSGVQPVGVDVGIADGFTSHLIPRLDATLKASPRPIKAVVLTNPHNPFGQCYPKHVIEKCIRFCKEKQIHFISDEVYAMSSFKSKDSAALVPFTSALSIDVEAIGGDPAHVHVIWSISKDFGSSGFRMGFCITQANRALQVGLALAANTQISSLTALFTRALLISPKLPALLKINAAKLSEAYRTMTDFFECHGIEYLPVSHGPFVFAKVVANAISWEDEALAVACCKEAGVVISSGKAYHIIENEKGWARLTFAIKRDQLDEALRRLERGLAKFQAIRKFDGQNGTH